MRIKLYILFIYIIGLTACQRSGKFLDSEELPPIYPDYTDVTIPCNIAPMNFLLRNYPEAVEVKLKGSSKELLIRDIYKVQFAESIWKSLLEAEKGNSITVHIKVKIGGEWIQYAPFQWHVVPDKIDPYLSYTFVEPGYKTGKDMQLRERNIENFKENVIADNNLIGHSYMNYHIYGNQDPGLSLFYIKAEKGGIILNRNGILRKLKTKTTAINSSIKNGNIHPSGRYAVFSINNNINALHTNPEREMEIYDKESDIVVFDFDENKIIPFPSNDTIINKPFRTFPVFSANGTSIYYCEAPYVELPDSIYQLMYSLYRIGFDPLTRSFGNQVDTLFSAFETGQSVSFPKVSPDGNYLLYTVANYGTFPIGHDEADLQKIDLQTGIMDSLQIVNADYSNTYNSWSSNSKWFVFTSKRDDGVYEKPYFCYINSLGIPHKPFVLPQYDPARYDYSLKSFNIPELSKGKLRFNIKDIEEIYYSNDTEILFY